MRPGPSLLVHQNLVGRVSTEYRSTRRHSKDGKDKDLQVAVRGTWSHDLGDHSSALETNAALALGLRYTTGQPREQKA